MSRFTKNVLSISVGVLLLLGSVQGYKYYQSLPPGPPPVRVTHYIMDGDHCRPLGIDNSALDYYAIKGDDLMACLPDEAIAIKKLGRNLYVYDLEVDGRSRRFLTYFTRTHAGYWSSSVTELRGE